MLTYNHAESDLGSPVDVGHGQVEGLRLQLVLLPDLDKPVHQYGAHGVRDVRLLDHVVMLRHKLHLLLSEVGINVLRKSKGDIVVKLEDSV